jgi:hypothetical protein
MFSYRRSPDDVADVREEAAALASITLFVAMVPVWAQVIPQL